MTVLSINGIGIVEYAARSMQEQLSPIAQTAQLRRTVNGTLVDLGDSSLRKYALSLSCTDQASPAFNNIWPGQQVTVDCITELVYVTSGGSAARTVVPGSSRVEGSYTFYRPRLTMRLVSFSITTDERGAEIGWQMALEEV